MSLDGQGDTSDKRRRFASYPLWNKLLHKRRTRWDNIFDFDKALKRYVKIVASDKNIDTTPQRRAIVVSSLQFVKFVVRILNEDL